MGLAAGMTLTLGVASAQSPPADFGGTSDAAMTRQSRVHNALRAALDCYRRDDYELAATYLQQAQAGQDDLTPDERVTLKNYQQLNTRALEARREGTKQLRIAEQAIQQHRTQDAIAALKAVMPNQQFLRAAEKQRFQVASEQVMPRGSGAQPSGGSNQAALAQARSKLKQARVMMARGQYDAAQSLALEADRLNVSYVPGEDTPKKVLDDIQRTRSLVQSKDPKILLSAARKALDHGDLDEADRLASEADRQSSFFSSMKMWGDSPEKVHHDVALARTRLAAAQSKSFKSSNTAVAPSGNNTETARQFLKDARRSLQAGNLLQAKQLVEKARALHPELNYWEDTPDKVMADIRQAESRTTSVVKDARTVDPHFLLKQGREMYHAGDLEQARKLAISAKDAPNAHWGLFDFDTPDRLLSDIRKAQVKLDQEQSGKVLTEARQQYERGNLKEAERLAHLSEQLHHGPYSIWELGDRPQKLIAEVDAAKLKQRSNQLPPPPAAVVKTQTPKPMVAKDAPPAPVWPAPVPAATPTPPQVRPAGMEQQATATPPSTSFAPPASFTPPAPATTFEDSKKTRAVALLSESRQLQKDGRLVEARQKALEAQRCGASFGASEDRPELALLAIAALSQKQIESLMQQANEYTASGEVDPVRYQRAEATLNQARQLAVGFGFDTQNIDGRIAWVQQVRAKRGAPVDAAAQSPVVLAQHQEPASSDPAQQQGRSLLEQARRELRAGQTTNARRIAESAFEPRYAVQTEALQLLRSIDAEEYNQRVLAASRSFDTGATAFSRGDYAQAMTVFRNLDPQLLPPEKQAQLREYATMPQLGKVAQAGMKTMTPAEAMEAGRTRVSDLGGSQSPGQDVDFARQVKAMQEVKFQKLRSDGLQAQSEATRRFQAGETDRALDILREYEAGLKNSGLDADKVALLRRPIEARLAQLNLLKHQRDFETQFVKEHDSAVANLSRQALAEQEKKKQMAELMKRYNSLYHEGKYEESEKCALQAKELDPDDAVATAALIAVRTQLASTTYQKNKEMKAKHVEADLNEAENPGPVLNEKNPIYVDAEFAKTSRKRKPLEDVIGVARSNKDREIYRRLDSPVGTLDYKDTPLRQILDDLRGTSAMNIVPDEPALNEAGINLDRPVTMKLDNIALKSALKLLLHQVGLTYVVKDEVLQVTTEAHAHDKLVTKTYPVYDLVIPVSNVAMPDSIDPLHAFAAGNSHNVLLNGTAPWLGSNSLGGGKDVSQGGYTSGALAGGSPGNAKVTTENPKGTMEDVLIKMVTNVIAPQTWDSVGGQGHIEYYPLGGGLIITQTPDIQEQVEELLTALRRLQDQEVAVEIRFISIAESFYERMGVDFNINIRTDNTKYQPQLVSQQFTPFGFINRFSPSNFISGITPAGSLTQDLSIPITNSSFQMAVPPFGQYPAIPGGNGGLSLGLAFLSDVEVSLFMEAAQGDTRTNVMQAPKLTLFNGQTSTLTVADQQFFVVAVTVVQAGGQVVFVPNNTPLPTGGVTLTMNAVISADRRYVRMSVTPVLTNLASANVPLFPITTFITPIFEGGAVGQPIPFTQFLQQPAFDTVSVNTTVNVPDGGTVLLGGLKRLSEGRNEFGPPILSKIPYLDRLFRNTAYGRDTESLLMMITPRIIINEEEELRQVPGALPGATPNPLGVER
jgi:Flp pilus assembly secretin CpaC/tetratricopeptide (TPR) repeat protein